MGGEWCEWVANSVNGWRMVEWIRVVVRVVVVVVYAWGWGGA